MTNYLIKRNLGSEIFDEALNAFFRPISSERIGAMRTDVKQTEKEYLLEIELAGFSKEEIQLSYEKGYLTVSANKKEEEEKKDEYLKRERSLTLSRSYYVGEVNKDGIKAKYENGILAVTIPKKEKEDPVLKNVLID